jgi:effector-binding domain-containing protein
MNTEKSIVIESPAPFVYNLVNNLQKTEMWNEWTLSDTTNVATYNEIAEGVGATSSWTGEKNGAGTQKIIEAEPFYRVKSEMTFNGWDGKSYAEMAIIESGGKSNVKWTFTGDDFPFLFRGAALLMGMKGIMTEMYTTSLENLKKIVEPSAMQGVYYGYQITEQDLPEKYFVMNRQEVKIENIQSFYSTSLGGLFAKVQGAGVEMDGVPCGLIFNYNTVNGTADMAAAIPIKTPLSISGTNSLDLPASPAIVLDYYGDYASTEPGHAAIDEYMKDRRYLQDWPVIEQYVTDPSIEPDPNKRLTKIIYYFTPKQN